jgi:hypothetical protein
MDSLVAERAGEMIEAMLLAPILRPMVAGMSVLGDYELDLLAGEMARHDSTGFARLIARCLERTR